MTNATATLARPECDATGAGECGVHALPSAAQELGATSEDAHPTGQNVVQFTMSNDAPAGAVSAIGEMQSTDSDPQS